MKPLSNFCHNSKRQVLHTTTLHTTEYTIQSLNDSGVSIIIWGYFSSGHTEDFVKMDEDIYSFNYLSVWAQTLFIFQYHVETKII